MRKRPLSREQQLDVNFRAEIARQMKLTGEKPQDVWKLLGISRGCWYNKLKEPWRFTLGDIRRLARHFDMTADAVCQIVGVSIV